MTLSHFILANIEPILVEWEKFAKSLSPGATMDAAALRDDAEAILIAIAQDMVTEQSDDQQGMKSRGKAPRINFAPTGAELHGGARLGSGFNLNEMVSEYRALRSSVIRLWQGPDCRSRESLYEVTRFDEGIDQALAESVAHFTAILDKSRKLDEQRKNEFLATLGHELRNPLAPLRTAVDSMHRNANPTGDALVPAKTVAMMERQVGHMARLIDDLLDVARIESGKLELLRQPVDMVSIVNEVLEASGFQRRLTPPSSEPLYVEGDAARLTQVVSNLLNNAIKFSKEASPVDVSVARVDNRVELTVKDSGIGIPSGKLEEIFEMFTQINGTNERLRSGLGIGLSLARRIVEMHGGTIHATSARIARGSTFIVRLPETSQAPLNEPVQPIAYTVNRKSILIVDDNRDAADTMEALLSSAGHDVHVVYDGVKALASASELKPDIILLDLGMPEMDGIEVAKKIRQANWSTRPTLVAMTGWGQHEDFQRSKDAGFDFHFVKPVSMNTLQKLFNDIDQRLTSCLAK